MLTPGWWAVIEGEQDALRELAMHFSTRELKVVEDEDGFHLGSTDFSDMTDTDAVRGLAAELVAIACGAAEIEIGGIRPPRVVAAVNVDESGAKQRLTRVSASLRTPYEIHQHVERVREDGLVEVVEVGPPLPREHVWAHLSRTDDDVADALAILGRYDLRWHDLYHVLEIVESEMGARIYTDGWTTKPAVRRFKHTANSRRAIGREARHGHREHKPPQQPMQLAEAKKLIIMLVRKWLATKVPPPEPRVIRVVAVRSNREPAQSQP